MDQQTLGDEAKLLRSGDKHPKKIKMSKITTSEEKLRKLWEEHLATKYDHHLDKEMKLDDIHMEIELDDTSLGDLFQHI